jgi:chitin-binding protein
MPHKTRDWRYFITRADWDPNRKLSRASFDAAPFCTVDGGNVQPPSAVSHQCTVPQRSGYQVIMAVWQVYDTSNSFYNVADVQFGQAGTAPPSPWIERGTIYPSLDLAVGDAVATRVFDSPGEHPERATRITIGSASEGLRNNWAHQLATRINAEQPQLQAGQPGQDGRIVPVYGQNLVYARAGSPWTRIEIEVDKDATPAQADVTVSDLRATYAIRDGQSTVNFSVNAAGAMDLSAYVYDQAGVAKGYAAAPLDNNSAQLSVSLNGLKAGLHKLVLKAVSRDGGALLQKSFSLTFTGDGGVAHAYVFPASLSSYKSGTRVLQPKDGKVYTCKPLPHGGWCAQWTPTSPHYEPGVGSDWQDAWIAP